MKRYQYTLTALVIFLGLSHFPLIGLQKGTGSDPVTWFRALSSSIRGTLMEFGLMPIDFATMAKDYVRSKHYNISLQLVGIIAIFIQASVYVAFGMCGFLSSIGMHTSLQVILQLSAVTILLS